MYISYESYRLEASNVTKNEFTQRSLPGTAKIFIYLFHYLGNQKRSSEWVLLYTDINTLQVYRDYEYFGFHKYIVASFDILTNINMFTVSEKFWMTTLISGLKYILQW